MLGCVAGVEDVECSAARRALHPTSGVLIYTHGVGCALCGMCVGLTASGPEVTVLTKFSMYTSLDRLGTRYPGRSPINRMNIG